MTAPPALCAPFQTARGICSAGARVALGAPACSAILCISIHRTTVKNTARTLENLSKAIQEDPVKSQQRVKDARVAPLTCDVVRAVRAVAPYESAYKSVSKRRQLAWDPNMGDDAGELDSFIRFLIHRLVNSLKGKAINYTKHSGDLGQARSSMFMMNNTFYLRDELGPQAQLLYGKTCQLKKFLKSR